MSSPKPTEPEGPNPPLSQQDVIATAKWLRLLIILGAVLGLVAVCWVLLRLGMEIHHTLILFALGGLVAYAVDPAVEFLRRPFRGNRTMAVLAVFLGLFLCFCGATWWLGGQAAAQFKAVQEDGPEYKTRALSLAQQFDANFLKPRGIDFSVEKTIQSPPPEYTTYAENVSKQALPFLAHTASNLGESTVVLFIALYLLIFSEDMKEKFNGMLSKRLHDYVVPWEIDANRILGGFVRGQLILALITGVVAAIGLLIVGVHLWLVIGLFVVAASLIPVIGPYVAAVPAIIAALVGPTRADLHLSPIGAAIAVLVLFVFVNEAGSKILYPKLVGKALNLHEVVVLFALLAGLEIGGILGTLFAAPVTALLAVTTVHLYRMWQELPDDSLGEENDRLSKHDRRLKLFKKSPNPEPEHG